MTIDIWSDFHLHVFVIKAVSIWCVTYEVSLLPRFLIALFVWYRQPKPEQLSLTGQG